MTPISINDTVKAGALDATLAFSVVFEEHRLLVSQSVSSGFKGLINSLDSLSSYSRTVESLQDAINGLNDAYLYAISNPVVQNGTTANTSTLTAVNSGLNTQAAPLTTSANNAITAATNALNACGSGTPERTAAQAVKTAAEKIKSAVDLIRAGDAINGFALAQQALTDANAAKTQAQLALNNATSAQTAANSQLSSANAQLAAALAANPQVPANIAAAQLAVSNANAAVAAANERVSDAQAVVNAATTTVNAAQAVIDFRAEPIAQIKLTTEQKCYELGDGYSLTTWGTTGYATLTGLDGKGVLIQPDGSVDPLDGSGNGWKFSHTSTFVLPNETKITITPNVNGATFSVIRGRNHLELTNVKANATPSGVITQDGRRYDQTTIDGYRIDMDTGTDRWKLGVNVLGDTGSREQVAQSASNNQFLMDASDIPIPAELASFLDEIEFDITAYDLDGDGKLNEEEFYQISTILNTMVVEAQQSFANILMETTKASEALVELNRFLEGLQQQGQSLEDGQEEATSEEKDLLASIQRRLETALTNLQALQGGAGGASANDARTLLANLVKASKGEEFETTGNAPLPKFSTSLLPQNEPAAPEGTGGAADPVSQAFKRAGFLLSGLTGGYQIDESLFPGAPTLPSISAEDVALLASLAAYGLPLSAVDAQALLTLVGKLQAELANGGLATLNGEGLQILESVKAALASVGLVELTDENSQFLADLAAQLRGLNIGLAESFELEELLARLRRGPAPTESSSPAVGLSTDVRKLTIADVQRLESILARLQDLELGLSPDDQRRLETLQRLLTGDLQSESSASAGGGTFGARVLTRADVQLFVELMAKLRGEDPDVVLSSLVGAGLPAAPGNPFLQNTNNNATQTALGNLETDPELLDRLKENVGKTLKMYNEQLFRARALFQEAQESVQKFVLLVQEDDAIKEIVTDDKLSDEEQENFADRMRSLHQKWGMDWGSDTGASTDESKLAAKVAQSGMMI